MRCEGRETHCLARFELIPKCLEAHLNVTACHSSCISALSDASSSGVAISAHEPKSDTVVARCFVTPCRVRGLTLTFDFERAPDKDVDTDRNGQLSASSRLPTRDDVLRPVIWVLARGAKLWD